MKAIQINSYGGTEVLEVNNNAPRPTPKPGQVLVEVYAASINPVDWKIRAGYLKEFAPLQFPATLGGDFAGRVIQLGEGITAYKMGDEVYGSAIILNGGSGAFAEFVAVNSKNIAKKPQRVNFIEAAALPLVGTSALQGLEEHIKLQSKQKILIHGGVGGIGHIAIQLAKSMGAYVATTISGDDIEFVKELGADEAIDYKTEDFVKMLKDYDAVFDMVGGETTNKSFHVLKKGLPAGRQGGILVSMLGQPDPKLAEKYGVIAIGQNTGTNSKQLQRLAELVDSGKIKVHVDKVFPLDKVEEAFAYQEHGHPRGKVVSRIKD